MAKASRGKSVGKTASPAKPRARKKLATATAATLTEKAGDSLLLGWELAEAPTRIGFGEAPSGPPEKEASVWLEGEGHMITIASTGAGKGRGALIPNLLLYEGPAIVIDPKGEACRITARRRREMGQKIHVIDPFNLVTDQTDRLNPLDAFDVPGAEHSSVAIDIARQLSGGMMSLKEPFWDIRGHDVSAGVISAVASIHEGEERSLRKVRQYLKSDDLGYSLAVFLERYPEKLHRFALEEISSVLQLEERVRSSIFATTCSYYSIMASEAAQRTLGPSTIDLQAVRRGDPMTIYLVVPPTQLGSHASLFRLWTSTLMSAVLSRDSELPEYRTLFAIDECAQLSDFGMLAMVYTLARSYGVRVWTFFQDLAQIQEMLPNNWRTVITNAAALQVFGVPNHLMAADLARVLGDFSEDELRQMDRVNLALQAAGHRGMTIRRPDYLNDKVFEGLFDPHPLLSTRQVQPAGGFIRRGGPRMG